MSRAGDDEGTEEILTPSNDSAPREEECRPTDSSNVDGAPLTLPYPKSVFFLIITTFCERFNYLGMRSIHSLYFNQKLKFDKNTSTVLYHAFTVAVYFMCIFGAIISDSWLGKFQTILFLFLLYTFGTWTVVVGAIPVLNLPTIAVTMIGLALIAIGCGGIRPCFAAFGGDQFELPMQTIQMATYFSIYYSASNAGSVMAKITTPIFRQDVHCFGDNDCYPLAFGIPGLFVVIAIVLFVCGTATYKIRAPSGNMLVLVTKCIRHAIVTKRRATSPRDHWLDHSEEKYGRQLVDDIKALLKILVLYIPLPFFWALFDQQGSRWTFQAQNMDGDIGFYTIKPDQMHVANPLLVLIFIPLFETVIYPLLAKIGIRRPLQKMTIGMFLAAIAYTAAAIVEIQVEKTQPIQPTNAVAEFRFFNGLSCDFTVQPPNERFTLKPIQLLKSQADANRSIEDFTYTITSGNSNCPQEIYSKEFHTFENAPNIFVSTSNIGKRDMVNDNPWQEPTPMLRIWFASLGNSRSHRVKISSSDYEHEQIEFFGDISFRKKVPIRSGVNDVLIHGLKYGSIELEDGRLSTLVVVDRPDEANEQNTLQINSVDRSKSKSLSMLWLLPQYVFITLAEVMFAITGIEFSYSQAPSSMKSVLQACWLLTSAFGNIIIIAVAESRFFHSQAYEFLLFAGLMLVDTLIFITLAMRYKRTESSDSEATTVTTA